MSSARAWLELFRVSNLPTVASNALAGLGVGAAAMSISEGALLGGEPIVRGAWLAACAPPLAYLAGMALNDAFDAAVDAVERPARPIPSGRVKRSHAFVAGFALLALALALAAASGSIVVAVAASLLAAAIVAYDIVHTHTRWAVVLLAICRALASLVPMLAIASDDPLVVVTSGAVGLPLALAAWTLALSIVARREAEPAPYASDATAAPCHRCGHLAIDRARPCAECGAAQNCRAAEARLASGSFRRLAVLGVGCVVLAVLLFLSIPSALGTEKVLRFGLERLAFAAMPALVLTIVALRARRAIDRSPRAIPGAVGAWIACLALVDAIALVAAWQLALASACAACFVATRVAQRSIAGS